MKTYLILFFVFFISGCTNKPENEKPYPVEIPIDQYVNYDFHIASTFRVKNTDYLAFYDETYHKIVIIDYFAGKILKEIELFSDGPDAIDFVLAIHAVDLATYWVKSGLWYYKIDDNGRILKKFKLNKEGPFALKGIDFGRYRLMHGLTINQEIFEKSKPNAVFYLYDMLNPLSLDTLMLAVVNLEEEKVQTIRIPVPENLKPDEGQTYSDLQMPLLLLRSDTISFCFPYSSDIFEYNFVTSTLKVNTIGIQPKVKSLDISVLNSNPGSNIEYRANEPHFWRLLYQSGKYIRVFKQVDTESAQDMFQIDIFDFEGNNLRNIDLPQVARQYFAIDKYLVIKTEEAQNESNLLFWQYEL